MKKNLLKNTLTALVAIVMVIVTILNIGDSNTNEPKSFMGASWAEGFETFEEMADSSDLIVKGKVVNHVPEKIGNLIFTKSIVEVDEILFGEIKSNISEIVINQTGGEFNGESMPAINDDPILLKGQEYLLFLRATEGDIYIIMGGIQGSYELKGNSLKPHSISNFIAKDIKEQGFKEVAKYVKKLKIK